MNYYRYRMNRISLAILFCTALWLVAVPRGWGQSEHTAKLIDGAKKEEGLVWYTSMNVSDSRRLLDAFEKKFPFVKTELFRAGTERTMNRIMTETRAGRWEFDLVSITRTRINILVQHKRISPYISPEAKAYSRKFKDPPGHWTAVYSLYYVIGYNTQKVSEVEGP